MRKEEEAREFIEKVLPAASEAELIIAKENFRGYLAVVIRIYQRENRKESADSLDNATRDTLGA